MIWREKKFIQVSGRFDLWRVRVQRTKKVVSGSLGLVDFAIGLVNSVVSLPDRQVMFFEEFEWQKNCEINSANQEVFGLVEMTSGLVNASFSLSEWQAVKMIFFAPCELPSVKLQ